jgi:hypothetical protein
MLHEQIDDFGLQHHLKQSFFEGEDATETSRRTLSNLCATPEMRIGNRPSVNILAVGGNALMSNCRSTVD